MKINSIYIHAFGGIKGLTLNFSEGLNVIYGDNEMGKTTVMSFIKMMFYGSGRASSQLSKNIRQKYTPWDGTAAAGSIDFTHNGKEYRLEKEFRSSNSTDKATLCDLSLGTRKAVGSDVGNSIFGMSLSAFERSVFIGQLGYPEKDSSAEGEINARLSNMALTGEESISYDQVMARITKAKTTLMSKSGKAGIYDKNLKLRDEFKEKISNSEALQRAVLEKKAKIEALEKEMELYGKNALELKAKIDAEQDIRNAQKLQGLLDLKAQLNALNETLRLNDGTVIDEMYLGKLRFCLSKLNGVKEKINGKQRELELIKKSLEAGESSKEQASEQSLKKLKDDISALEAKKEKYKVQLSELKAALEKLKADEPKAKKAKKKINLVLFIAGLCVAVASVFWLPLIAAGVIAVVLSFILRPFDRKPNALLQEKILNTKAETEKLTEEYNNILNQINGLNSQLKATESILSKSSAIEGNQKRLLAETEAELLALNGEKTTEEKNLLEQFSKYKSGESCDEVMASIEEIEVKAAAQKELKQQLSFILKDLNGISYDEAERKLTGIKQKNLSVTVDFSALKAEYESLLSVITDCKTAKASLLAEIKAALSGFEDIEQLKKQLLELEEKIEAQKEYCTCLDIAATALGESFAEVRRSYGSALEQKAGEILEGLTAGKYNGMSISKSLDIAVQSSTEFGSREIDYMSSGTADQAYLSMRLAITELMCSEEALPIFLDDSLTQYDDSRLKQALIFLNEYSKSTQAIMFTCHSSIYNLAESIGACCKMLKNQ